MPKLTHQLPKYRRHRASGQAVVRLHGRDFYLGPYRSRQSRQEYNRLVAEYLARDREPPPPKADEMTVLELMAAYSRHVKKHYCKGGRPTSEQQSIKDALRPVKIVYGHTLAKDFGPLALQAVRQKLIESGLVRGVINAHVSRVRRMFKWAVSTELLPVTVHQALRCVDGLQRGRGEAEGIRESRHVEPVTDQQVQAVLPLVSKTIADMIRFQRLTGCRPGEVCVLRPIDLDQSSSVWAYRPHIHKTEHRGRERVIPIGPKAQDVIRKYLVREAETYCFVPVEQQKKRWPTSTRRRKKRFRGCGERYDVDSLRKAIHRACLAAGIPPWSPNQLRHATATEIRRRYGVEGSQVVLGHGDAFITQVYAERDWKLAERIALEVG